MYSNSLLFKIIQVYRAKPLDVDNVHCYIAADDSYTVKIKFGLAGLDLFSFLAVSIVFRVFF